LPWRVLGPDRGGEDDECVELLQDEGEELVLVCPANVVCLDECVEDLAGGMDDPEGV
jgi:hypothetical protein